MPDATQKVAARHDAVLCETQGIRVRI